MTLATYNAIVDMFLWACFVVKLTEFINNAFPTPTKGTP